MRSICLNLAALATMAVAVAAWAAPKPPPPPRVVQAGPDGRLAYAADARGNRVPDFSHAGYLGGDSSIPTDIPVRVVVGPKPGDQTARIQAAIDHVAALPLDDRGFRGVVLLQAGRFEVAGGLRIAASGVVLRGSGTDRERGTLLVATGHDRRTLITVAGKDDRTVGEPVAIADAYVPVNATTFRVASPGPFKPGDAVLVRRPCTAEWIQSLGMHDMGGERHGFSWRPGTRELAWDRIVTKVEGDAVTVDAPLTCAIEAEFGGGGGGAVAAYRWPGRVRNVGVEHLRCESAFDSANPNDEDHAWFGVTMEHAQDAWVRQVAFAHFAGGAAAVWDSCKRVTVEDCASLDPVSEVGGHRRHTFFTGGQQVLFQRCYSEQGRHDFAVGFCAAGPNAFVQCEAAEALDDSGAIDSWSAGTLFDNVRIDGNAISLHDRRYDGQGAGWSAANSMAWQSTAAVIRCFSPPGATNWAVGCWSTFDGNGVWQSSNEFVRPISLYYAQLADRIGKEPAARRAQLMLIPTDASTSPTIEQAARHVEAAREPMPQLSQWIRNAPSRNPIPVDADGAPSVDDLRPRVGKPRRDDGTPGEGREPREAAQASQRQDAAGRTAVRNGWLVKGDRLIVGGRQNVMWWRGGTRPHDTRNVEPSITRYVPGRTGRGLTDDLVQVADDMQSAGKAVLNHNYGLWYDRRRDDHQRVRRMTGDVWPPFYEQPFARSGRGAAWDGLSRYDLTKYNPWYFDRLRAFAGLCDARGMLLLNNHYFQHNILEAGAHYADFPWRTANNVNDTGFPEPPPYAGDKRIFLAEPFYDVNHSTRRALHRAYVRKSLENFPAGSAVVHLTSAEYTGPLHFVEFWLDTAAEWERETGRDAILGLSATKDVQDAILADPERAPVVSVIEMKYWWNTADGGVYDPKGGQSLAPRQHQRVWKGPSKRSDAATARQIREYRTRFPDKAILCDYDGLDGWVALAAGASAPPIRENVDERLLAALPRMRPYEAGTLSAEQWALAEPGRDYLVCSLGEPNVRLELPAGDTSYDVRWIATSDGKVVDGDPVKGGAVREFSPPGGGRHVLWVSRN